MPFPINEVFRAAEEALKEYLNKIDEEPAERARIMASFRELRRGEFDIPEYHVFCIWDAVGALGTDNLDKNLMRLYEMLEMMSLIHENVKNVPDEPEFTPEQN